MPAQAFLTVILTQVDSTSVPSLPRMRTCTHTHTHGTKYASLQIRYFAGSRQLAGALRALGKRHGLSGLRVWPLFCGRALEDEDDPAQYTAGPCVPAESECVCLQ